MRDRPPGVSLGAIARARAQRAGRVWRVALGVSAAAIAIVGCGKADLPTQSSRPSGVAQLGAVCALADREALQIDRQLAAARAQLIAGHLRPFIEAAQRAQRLDEATAANINRLPPSSYTATFLARLSRGRAELHAITEAVRRRGLTRGLISLFLRANRACGSVRLQKPKFA